MSKHVDFNNENMYESHIYVSKKKLECLQLLKDTYADICISLMFRNSKMRLLIQEMAEWMSRAVHDRSIRESEYEDFLQRMKELEIEVYQ